MSRERLSELVGVSVKSLQRYEEGRQTPRVDTLYRLSAVLSVPVASLVGDAGSEVEKMLALVLERLNLLTDEVRELRQAVHRE